MVPLVALHAVVWGQLLPGRQKGPPRNGRLRMGKQTPRVKPLGVEAATHHTTVFGVCALEMACHAQDGFPEVSHQFRLLDVLGLERLQVVYPWEVQRVTAAGVPAKALSQPQGSLESIGVRGWTPPDVHHHPHAWLPQLRRGRGAGGGRVRPSAQLPAAQSSPKSKEVRPDFLRWVLRRTTCRHQCGSVAGGHPGPR